MPYAQNSGVSQRIECETERVRLRACLDAFRLEHKCGGFIARTAAECVDETVLIADMTFLLKLWESIAAKIAGAKPKQFIHKDLPLSIRTLRDLYREGIERVRVDSRETYHRLVEFAEIFVPEIVPVIEHYTGECPVFDIYSVEDEIQKALERKVNLKSGGHLVFDQTESMTTVDVNTGGYVGGRNLEETIFKTNLEAAQTISRQLRLRNLGGIIIIDFIDMQSEDHKKQVLQAFERHLGKRPRENQYHRSIGAGVGGNDPQKNPGKSGTYTLRTVQRLRRSGRFEDRRIHVPGNISGDYSRSQAVQSSRKYWFWHPMKLWKCCLMRKRICWLNWKSF